MHERLPFNVHRQQADIYQKRLPWQMVLLHVINLRETWALVQNLK